MGIKVVFVQRENSPERLVSEGELLFEDGLLAGMKLVGFSLWRSPEGEVYVTFPSRAFGAGGDRQYFDYLRGTNGGSKDAKRVKAWILEEWRNAGGADNHSESAPLDGSASGAKSSYTV